MNICLSSICKGSVDMALAMLESAAPYVDEAVIVVAPGDLLELDESHDLPVPTTRVEHPWQGYATTRTIALKEAEKRAEWVLTLDDDDRYQAGGILPPLEDNSVDAYTFPIIMDNTKFYRPHLTRRGHEWRFEGCGSSGLHEALYGNGKISTWNKLVYVSAPASIQSAERYTEHARLLKIALDEEPKNTRTAFYLAQSLRDEANLSGGKDRTQLATALAAYIHRANMAGGFYEETFWAWMNAGRLAWRLGFPWEACVAFYEYAQTWDLNRAEPLLDLARLYEAWGKLDLALNARRQAMKIPYPTHARLFIEPASHAL